MTFELKKQMGRFFSVFLGLIHLAIAGQAQSKAGITGIPDTSYTNYAAYNNIKKQHPYAILVPDSSAVNILEKKDVVYCKTDGRSLRLDVFQPRLKGRKNRPAIMIIHGGGWRSGNRTQHHALAQRLALLGYVCFTPEYRLSTEALYPAAVHDLKTALRWIHQEAKSYRIDTGKIAVMGFSAGGQLAALLGTTLGSPAFEGSECHLKFTSNVQAIVDLDGTLSFVHPESGEGDDSKKTSAATYWFGYPKKEKQSIWEEASPLTHVGRNTPPTLFINSSVERMHAGRDDFMRILAQHGIYSEVKTFADAPHHFPMFEPWFTPMIQHIDNFLKMVFDKKQAKKKW